MFDVQEAKRDALENGALVLAKALYIYQRT
jgi:hypothetical protein